MLTIQEVLTMAERFNQALDEIDPTDEKALDAHECSISNFAYGLPEDLREIFINHCIMPER